MPTTKPTAKGRKAGAELARQAFIHGEGDGKPVMDMARLIEISGLSAPVIKQYMNKWLVEREKFIIESGKSSLGYHLSGETLENHKADVDFLREQANSLKLEADNLEVLNEKLLEILENLSDNLDFSHEDADKLLAMAKSYFAGTANRQKVLTLFLAAQKRWQESSGMQSQLKAWEVGQREAEKGRMRVQTKKEEVQLLKDGEIEIMSTPQEGIFARRKK